MIHFRVSKICPPHKALCAPRDCTDLEGALWLGRLLLSRLDRGPVVHQLARGGRHDSLSLIVGLRGVVRHEREGEGEREGERRGNV